MLLSSYEDKGINYTLAQKFLKWRRVKNKDYHYLRNYKISLNEVSELKRKQNNCCGICKKSLEKGKKTHIDHDHYSLKVRGVLCSNCNLGLGNFKDSIENLESAITYLRKANDVS